MGVCFMSDDADEISVSPLKRSVVAAETKHRESRAIWSVAEMVASSSGNESTLTAADLHNNRHYPFSRQFSNSAQHRITTTYNDVIRSLPVISAVAPDRDSVETEVHY